MNQLKTENMKLREHVSDLEEEVKRMNCLFETINESSSEETPTPSPTKVLLSSIILLVKSEQHYEWSRESKVSLVLQHQLFHESVV